MVIGVSYTGKRVSLCLPSIMAAGTAVGPIRRAGGSDVKGIRIRPGRLLLTASGRVWAGALLAGCAILIVLFGMLFAHQANANGLDRAIDSPIISWLSGDPDLASHFAAPGSLRPAVTLTAVIVVACLFARRLNGAVLAAAAIPAAAALTDGLCKPLVHRTYHGALTYPSGHTATMFALAATITLLLIPPPPAKATALQVLIPAAACALGGVVAVGVIGLRFHYFTDTVAGAALGIGTVCGLALLLDLPTVRRWLAWGGHPSR